VILSKRPEVERFLAAPPADVRAALIHGRDRSGVRERADRLAARVTPRPDDPFDTASLSDGDVEADALLDALSALSMGGGRRLVRVRLTTERVGPERAVVEALQQHLEGACNPDAFLLIEAGELGKSSPLRKAAENAKTGAVSIVLYDDEPGDIARLTRETLAADKVSLTTEALDAFVARLPHERGVARQEIERLALYLGPDSRTTAGLDDLTAFFGVEPEASLADAAVDAFGGRAAAAYAGLRRARAEGEGGPAVLRALGQHLGRLRRAAILTGSGVPPSQAAKSSGVFWKLEREFLRQLQAWRTPELEPVQVELIDADAACKQALAPDGPITERLTLTIAARARRLGL